MALAGALEIQLRADVARLQQDMTQVKSIVGTSARDMEAAFGRVGGAMGIVKGFIGGLIGTLSIGMFASMIKGAIDAADKLNDLSKSTNIAVEKLAGLELAARQSGTDLDGVASAVNKLSINIGKDAEKFRALGITAKDPLEAFKQLADLFRALEDPQQRAAVMAAALGKSWASAAPLLAEGGKRIGEMVADGERLSNITSDLTQKADEFNDELEKLKATFGGMKNAMLGDMLGPLTAIVKEMQRGAEEGGKLMSVIRGIQTLLTGDDLHKSNVQLSDSVGRLLELENQLLAVRSREVIGLTPAMQKSMQDAKDAEIRGLQAQIAETNQVIKTTRSYRAELEGMNKAQEAVGAVAKKAAATRAAAFLDEGKAAKAAADEHKKWLAELERLRKLDEAGWAAYYQERERLAAAESDAIVADLHKRNAELERLRKLDESGWAAYYEALEQQRDAESDAIVADLHKRNAEIAEAQKKLDDFLDPAKAKSFGDALSDAFGKAGSALGKLIVSFDSYGRKLAEIEKMRAENAKINDPAIRAQNEMKLAEQSAQAQISAYGDMAAAAKGFFEAGSSGYKALEAAEKVFRAFELASAIQSMLTKSGLLTAFTGLFVASKAAEAATDTAFTATSVANSGTRATADGIAAFAKTLASLPFPYNLAAGAAVIAALAAVGVAISGGGGGGGSSAAQDRQREQGTGTVLGDAEAKSNSLVNALEEIESIDRLGLVVLHDQLEALRAIQAAMGGLATLIFRTTGLTTGEGFNVATGTGVTARPGVGGLDRINQSIADAIGIGSIVSGILGLWGKTSTEITDSGLQIAGSVRDLIAGLGIAAYANVRTNSSSFFGLVRSSSESTETQPASDPVRRQIGMIFAGITDSVEAAAKALGIWFPAMSEHLRNFVVDIGKISFKDLKGQELEDAINAVFSSFADKLAASVLPTELLDQFQKVGEGAFETMVRLATENEVATNTLQALGLSINAAGLAGLTARLRLVELAGGIETFTEQTQSYFENYFSEVERHASLATNLNAEFVRLGTTMPTTKDGFRDLVSSLDLTTDSGRQMFAALMSINEPFAEWADSIVGLDGQLHTLAARNEQRAEAEDRLAILKGTKTEQQLEREREILGAIDEYNLMLLRAIHAQEDFNAATEAATARRRDEMALEAELAEAQGDMARAQELRYALETEGMNAAERASYDYTEALRQQIEVANLAAEAQRTRADLERELFDLTHSEAEVLANNRALRLAELAAQERAAGMEAGKLVDLQKLIDAAEDMKRAAEAAEEAAEDAARAAEAAADKVRQAWERFLQDAGVSVDGLADLLADRLAGESTQEEFAKGVRDMLVGGVYRAMANQTAAVISQIIADNLITPIMQSILQGTSVTAAINATLTQTNIDKMIDMATAAVEGLAAVFNDPAFKAAMQTFEKSIDGIVGSLSSLPGPVDGSGNPLQAGGHWDFSSGYGVWVTGSGGGTAEPIDNSQDILRQRLEMLARIYELSGDKAGAAAVLEQQHVLALAALDPSLRALQTQLWGLEAAAEAAAKAAEFLRTKRGLEIDLARALGNEQLALEMERADVIAEINAQWGAGTQQASELIALYQQLWAVQGQAGEATSGWIKTLQDWLQSLQLNDQLSPLTARQRFDFAQSSYVENLLKAQGGDLQARQEFTQFADAYLQESLAMFGRASTDYNAIWMAIEAQTQGLIAQGLGPNAPATMSDLNSTLLTGQQGAREQADALIDEVRSLRTDVANLTRRVEEGNEAVHEQTSTLEGAIDDNAPATARAIVNETGGGIVS